MSPNEASSTSSTYGEEAPSARWGRPPSTPRVARAGRFPRPDRSTAPANAAGHRRHLLLPRVRSRHALIFTRAPRVEAPSGRGTADPALSVAGGRVRP